MTTSAFRHALGAYGEQVAARHLTEAGLVLLDRNWRCAEGEIDLVLRDGDCLVFAEVKTRSVNARVRPAASVDRRKRRRLSRTALEYLRRLPDPRVRIRFDVVEVLHENGRVVEVRHLPCTFALTPPYRHG